MLMIDMLREVLGEEPSDRHLWQATRERGRSVKLVEQMLEIYKISDLEPVPHKDSGHFRPAFLSDYTGRSSTPYDREFTFVERALCYADSVAVRDEFAYWTQVVETSSDQVNTLVADWQLGFFDCDNATWALRRVCRYGWLEREGLLHYVDTPQRRDIDLVRSEVDESMLEALGGLVVQRQGLLPTLEREPDVVRPVLGVWLREFLALVEHVNQHDGNFDLFLPSWFAGPELLDWWISQSRTWDPRWTDQARHQGALTSLITLPALPDITAYDLDRSTLLAIREGAGMQRWRDDFQSALSAFAVDDSAATRANFRRMVDDARQRLEGSIAGDRRRNSLFSATLTTGVASGAMAALSDQDVIATGLIGAAPIVGLALVDALRTWLGNALVSPHSALPMYRLFMDGNQRFMHTGAIDMSSTPKIMGFDRQGNPVHLSLFDS